MHDTLHRRKHNEGFSPMTVATDAGEASVLDPSGVRFTPSRVRPGASRLRLQTLVRLRWLAVAGQAAAVLGVYVGLGFPLPLGPCLALIALSAWLNIFLAIRFRANLRLRNRYALFLLSYDVLQLTGLLYLTGGLQNPFAFLFLVPATVSASTLPLRRTLVVGVLTFVCISFLLVYSQPLPWYPDRQLDLPNLYLVGMWTALVCGLVFNSIYAWRVSEETRRMSDALAATEMVLAREQQLSALDGLAAAAAHELGTPLATIALVAKELKREMADADPHAEDFELLHSQAERCRAILRTLAQRQDEDDVVFARLRLGVMIEEIVDPLRAGQTAIRVHLKPGRDGTEPVFPRNPAILYGLGNLLDNAADFAASTVDVTAEWNGRTVAVVVEDDGPGFAQEIIDKLGEPYVTTRRSGRGLRKPGPPREGMGLGFFIAKTLLERSGASVMLANRPTPGHGAIVRVEWSRESLEAPSAA